LVVGCEYRNEPYHFINEKGRIAGFDVDLILATAYEAGVEVSGIRSGTRQELLRDLQEGTVQVIAGAYRTDEYDASCDFATPYLVVQHSIFAPAGSGIKSPADIQGVRVIVTESGPAWEYVKKNRITERISVVPSPDDAFKLLVAGGADCAVLPSDAGSALAEKTGWNKITAIGAPIFRAEYGFAVKKGNVALCNALSSGLSGLQTKGRFAALEKKWISGQSLGGPNRIKRVGVVVAIAVAVVLLLVLARVFMLRQITKRTIAVVGDVERNMAALKQQKDDAESEKQGLLSLVQGAPYGVLVLNGSGSKAEVIYLNDAGSRILGYAAEEIKTLANMWEIIFPDPEYRDRVVQRWTILAKESFKDGGFTLSVRVRNGSTIRVDFRASIIEDGRVAMMFFDATEKMALEEERQRLDEQIRQSQKLEAMGQLAGGVAHDFNNILTPILGNAQLIQMELGKQSENGVLLTEIVNAAKRAGELTKQLLAYARKGKFQIVPVDVHETVKEVVSLLGHSIDRLIEIKTDLQAEKPVIMGDPSQLQSAMLNLGVNARDAMPEGGVMTFSTRMVAVDKEMCRKRSYDIVPGEYLELRVSDSGVGMSKNVQARLFEPFFTTKKAGKGTGLGLAAVYGCMKNHHGAVEVATELGKGTTFSIILPSVGRKISENELQKAAEIVHGKGRILLVDDEDVVRTFTSKALTRLGYHVSVCSDGAKAVEFYREHHKDIDMVIMDLVMPNMDGRTAFIEMKKINPEIRLIVVSGFAADKTAVECMQQGALDFIPKPFRVEELSQAIASYIGKQDQAEQGQDPGKGGQPKAVSSLDRPPTHRFSI